MFPKCPKNFAKIYPQFFHYFHRTSTSNPKISISQFSLCFFEVPKFLQNFLYYYILLPFKKFHFVIPTLSVTVIHKCKSGSSNRYFYGCLSRISAFATQWTSKSLVSTYSYCILFEKGFLN